MRHWETRVKNARKWEAELASGGTGIFDSEEEVFMLRWLEEAQAAGYVREWARCAAYKLFDKVVGHGDWDRMSKAGGSRPVKRYEIKERVILREREYTPDFEFTVTQAFYDRFLSCREQSEKLAGTLFIRSTAADGGGRQEFSRVVCDVKGGYVLADRREEFNLKRHVMNLVHGVKVVEVDPAVLFALTWVPRDAAFTPKTGKRRSAFAGCALIDGSGAASGSVIPDIPDVE